MGTNQRIMNLWIPSMPDLDEDIMVSFVMGLGLAVTGELLLLNHLHPM